MLTLFAVLEFIFDFHDRPMHTCRPALLLYVFVWLKRLQFNIGLITRLVLSSRKQKGIAFLFAQWRLLTMVKAVMCVLTMSLMVQLVLAADYFQIQWVLKFRVMILLLLTMITMTMDRMLRVL